MKDIKIGFVGLGSRGRQLLKDVIVPQKEQVVALCDTYEDRIEDMQKLVKENLGIDAKGYTDYHEMLNDENITVVIIASSWDTHIPFALEAMEKGLAVGMEVGGAYQLEQCFELIKVQERTGVPFMLLENCCYGRRELMALNMVEKGILGEVVHCDGAYIHDLRDEVAFGVENRHYRLRNYMTRNCENYPTHEIGPIARVLNINHGNRMVSLSSFSSKAAGLHDFIVRKKSDDEVLKKAQFKQGDVITTVITCANGETITITLNTTLPHYYSRNFTVHGTRGFYEEETDSVYIDNDYYKEHHWDWRDKCFQNAKEYEEEYDHPIWKKFIADGVQGSHDGMDWLEFTAFFNALRNDEPMPIDVYDAATWMAITILSEMSIAKGGAPVDFPDFTNGKWNLDAIDNFKAQLEKENVPIPQNHVEDLEKEKKEREEAEKKEKE